MSYTVAWRRCATRQRTRSATGRESSRGSGRYDAAVAQPHVVILGGGFGGLSAARGLARAPVRVTVVDRENHHVFQPLLYQVATAALSPGDIASPIRWVLRRQNNVRVVLASAETVDVVRRVVRLRAEEQTYDLAYDTLIVATGATHAYFGHERWRASAPGLKTLTDALRIRRHVLMAFERAEQAADLARQRRSLTFVVVGGGPTGIELAGALAEISRHALARDFRSIDTRSARIILVEADSMILPTFPVGLRREADRALRQLGVEVLTGSAVQEMGSDWVVVGETRIEAETILWAAGVVASDLGQTLGVPLDRAGRVTVEADLSIPGHPEVFVIGDLASFRHQSDTVLAGVAPVAVQEGRHVARNIRHRLRGHPTRAFRYRNLGNVATIGRGTAVADFGWLTLSGGVAWLAWLFIHIWNLIGFRNRLVVLAQWAWSYVTYQRSVRLITDRPHDSDNEFDGSSSTP